MMRAGWPGDSSPSIESMRELRLRALLNDLVNDVGPGKLAEQFGVDRKTLWRWQRAAELPPRLVETLERMLLERAMAAMDEDRKRVRALEEQVSDLEDQLAAALATVNGTEVDNAVIDALRQKFTREIQRLERRLEIAMLDEHGLTLPPETAPLGGLDRREQWSWRERELAGVRGGGPGWNCCTGYGGR